MTNKKFIGKGSRVKVFEDPRTKKKVEGMATVMRIYDYNFAPGQLYGAVVFDNDQQIALREFSASDVE